VSGKDPIGRFKIQDIKSPISPPATTSPGSSPTIPMSDPQKCSLNHHHKKFVVTAVTDPRQTSQVETGYRETNACLEWIKYFVCTLSKKQNKTKQLLCLCCRENRNSGGSIPD
jgi:hypothetical protein